MRQTSKTGLTKIRFARGKFLSSAALLITGVLSTGAAAAQAQPPQLPLIAQVEPERRAALRDQAKTATEQTRQINAGDRQNLAESSQYIAVYEKAAKLWQAVGDKKQELEATLRIAWAYSASKQFAAALKNYESALILASAAAEPRQEYVALVAIAGIYQETNELQKSLEYLDRTLIHLRTSRFSASPPASMQSAANHAAANQAIVQPSVYLPLEDFVFGLIGDVYKKLDEPERAAEFYAKKLAAARAIQDAALKNELRQVQTATQNEQRAKTVFDQAAAASKRLNSASTVAERRAVIVKFEEAAKLWQAANNQKEQTAALNEVGNGYLEINEPARAIENYQQALALTRAANNKRGELSTLLGLGKSYEKANEPQTAIEHYKQALVILKSAEFANGLPAETAAGSKPSETENPKAVAESSRALVLLYIAQVYGKAKENQSALDYYQQAWAVVTAAKIYDGYAAVGALIGVTQTFLDLNQPSGATAFLDQEIARARVAKNVELEAVLTEFVAQIKSGSRKLKY